MDTEYFNEYLQSPALQAKYGSVGAYVNFMKSQEPEINQSDNTQDGNKFNFMDYLPFGSKSISGSIMRGIGQYMPDMDPRQKNLNQFYDVNNGTIQSGLMKDYNPVSGGLFGTPINYGLQDAYQKRIDTINNTLKRKYTQKGISFDKTKLDERRDQLIADMNNESNAMSGGGDGTFGLGTQGQKSYSNPGDTFGINAITGGPVSNKTGEGRTDYFFGGRVGYKVGGRTDQMGGTMEQTAAELREAAPDQFGGEMKINQGGNNGGDNFLTENNTPPTNVGNTSAMKQDNIMNAILSSRYGTDLEEDIDNPKFSMENMFGITSQVPENTKLVGLNKKQTSYLDTVGKKIRNVDLTQPNLYTYDNAASIKKEMENLNKKSTNMFGSFDPDKITYSADDTTKNTFATDKDVEKYMNDKYKLTIPTGGTKIGLAYGGRAMFKNGGLASIL